MNFKEYQVRTNYQSKDNALQKGGEIHSHNKAFLNKLIHLEIECLQNCSSNKMLEESVKQTHLDKFS
jgi:hypothetical protein